MSSRPSRGAARLAAILDALPDALFLVNANGTVVNANTIALEAFEAPGTALVGRGLLDLLPEFDSKLIPGSMRRPDHIDPRARTKPTRMVARRTDGSEFPVEVTSANLETGQQAYDNYGYAGDELLMLVVRDLSGTVDTEAELARSQRQTEMILRAAAEGVVGTDTDGRIVLVNPAAAQILGYRAGELGGRELHTLVLHSRADGAPFPYDESPLADTLRSGRKHRVRGQVLYAKNGDPVPVDLTTAPVRDGDQLVGAVMTFTDRRPYDTVVQEKEDAARQHTEELERLAEEHASELTAVRRRHATELDELREKHAEELAANEERYAALGEREKDRFEALSARHEQLLTLLQNSLRGPLEELRGELSALAADDAGQLWPEANQVLHHLSAGYSRITTLIDNVLGYQRLDADGSGIARTKVMLDVVVAAGVDGAVELVGPGRVQFAVHAPPIEAAVDQRLLATALAHLVADVAGVDATGNAPVSAGGYMDNTVVVAAAQRGEVVRIEVRGPYAGGDPVHQPIVRGIVRAHGGVLQTHEVPGMSGSAYVLEVPLGGGAGALSAGVPGAGADAAPETTAGGGRDGQVGRDGQEGQDGQDGQKGHEGRAGQDVQAQAGSEIEAAAPAAEQGAGGGGRRRARRSSVDAFLESEVAGATAGSGSGGAEAPTPAPAPPTGRRRRRAAAPEPDPQSAPQTAQVPAQASGGSGGTGRRRGRPAEDPGAGVAGGAAGVAEGAGVEGAVVTAAEHAAGAAASGNGLGGTVPPQGVPAAAQGVPASPQGLPVSPQGVPAGGGRRARRPVGEQHALPPALPAQSAGEAAGDAAPQPTGRRRRALAPTPERAGAPEPGPRQVFALPPAEADRVPGAAPGQPVPELPQPQVPGPAAAGDALIDDRGRHDAVPHDQSGDHTPPQPHPTSAPTGRRRRAAAAHPAEAAVQPPASHQPGSPEAAPAAPLPAGGQGVPARGVPADPTVPGSPVPVGAVPPQAPATGDAAPAARVAPGVSAEAAQTAQTAGAAGQPLPPPQAPAQDQGPPPAQEGRAQPHASGQPAPVAQPAPAPRAWPTAAGGDTPDTGTPVPADGAVTGGAAPAPAAATPVPPNAAPAPVPSAPVPSAPETPGRGTPLPPENTPRAAQPLPAEAGGEALVDPDSTQGRAISVRTLGQGVPFNRQAAQVQQPTATPAPQQPGGSGRRRKLGTPPDPAAARTEPAASPHPQAEQASAQQQAGVSPAPPPARPRPQPAPQPQPARQPQSPPQSLPQPQSPAPPGQSRLTPVTQGAGRSYAIGAPDENAAEGPEPLDGPGGAVEVADTPRSQPMDDELPPEPLDNPRRLLVWPAPDVSTQQALSDRGYRPVIVNSREEVDAQIAAFPAALFVDPLTGPITRTALQSLRQAAVAAEVPVMVTAGLGQASRDAAYGADPAVLLKALAPRDSEQHPPRVLLIEEHAEIALALTGTLERRGMQVARAASDTDAVTLAGQFRPNLVVMDLMQVHRRRAGFTGIIDWLRANGQLNRTPLVVYTAAVDQADLPRLASGETVLFLAERSTSGEVQARIVELLSRIGTN
ncbi:hybrid sensor histidine kinase/response regulator [Streptomyces poriticola]|uniref:hybrid sensor histidine kinase/response regulator n=1 Tax=Streptomyces poriticola TaxID=3120506 RepID=UPI002FCE2C7F